MPYIIQSGDLLSQLQTILHRTIKHPYAFATKVARAVEEKKSIGLLNRSDGVIVMPLDKLLYIEFVVLGSGILIGWNAILTAIDWLTLLFSEYNPSFILPIVNFCSCPIFQLFVTSKGHLISYNKRIVCCLMFVAFLLGLIPVVATTIRGSVGFAFVCVLVFLNGSVDSIAQTSVYGMAGMMPGEYTQAVMLGNSISGIILGVARVACLAIFSTDSAGLAKGTTVYFTISGVILVACCLTQLHITRHPLVKQNVLGLCRPGSEILISANDCDPPTSFQTPDQESVNYRYLFRRVWLYASLVFANFFTTCSMFPGVAISTSVEGLNYSWFVVLIVLTYYTFDFIGRQIVGLYMMKPGVLVVCTALRLLFWMTTLLIAAQIPPHAIFKATWFIFGNIALLAITNGYYCTQHMIYGPDQVKGMNKDKAGNIMSFSLSLGVGLGSFMSLAFVGVGHRPN